MRRRRRRTTTITITIDINQSNQFYKNRTCLIFFSFLLSTSLRRKFARILSIASLISSHPLSLTAKEKKINEFETSRFYFLTRRHKHQGDVVVVVFFSSSSSCLLMMMMMMMMVLDKYTEQNDDLDRSIFLFFFVLTARIFCASLDGMTRFFSSSSLYVLLRSDL